MILYISYGHIKSNDQNEIFIIRGEAETAGTIFGRLMISELDDISHVSAVKGISLSLR